MRPALAADAGAIAGIHREQMVASAEAGLEGPLGQAETALNTSAIAAQWDAAIASPPSAKHHVLTALEGNMPVGFAALAPAETRVDTGPLADTPADAEIVALAVAATHHGQGHEDRLLNALADILARTGARLAQMWVTVGDEWTTRLLHSSGFGPAGVKRGLAVGERRITQHLWYTDFSAHARALASVDARYATQSVASDNDGPYPGAARPRK